MTFPPWRKILRFAGVGGAATLVHLGVALVLHYELGLPALSANILAFCGAWSVSYIGNWAWTFDAATAHKISAPRFLAVSLGCLGLNQFLLWLAHAVAGWPLWLAMLPVVIAVPAASFAASTLWAFADTTRASQARS